MLTGPLGALVLAFATLWSSALAIAREAAPPWPETSGAGATVEYEPHRPINHLVSLTAVPVPAPVSQSAEQAIDHGGLDIVADRINEMARPLADVLTPADLDMLRGVTR